MIKGKAVIIAGSRNFDNYELLKNICDSIIDNSDNRDSITIISGGARGADKLGEKYSKDNNYNLVRKDADWNTYGRSAGYRRNCDMAIEAAKYESSLCVAFSVNNSRGTNHMIDICKNHRIPCLKVEIVDDSPTGALCTFIDNK